METPSCKFYPQHGSSRAWKRAPPPPRASHKPWSSEHNLLLASTLSRDAIFDLLPLSHPAIFIWRFHFPLPLYPRKGSPSVSRSLPPPLSTLCKTAPEFGLRFDFISSLFFTSAFTLSLFERLSLRLRQHVAWSAVPIPIGSIISD